MLEWFLPMIDPLDLAPFDGHWPATVKKLLPEIHPVDQTACLIWFQLFPMVLHELSVSEAANRTRLERYFQLRGAYRLVDQPDRSHQFLFSHRYWLQIREAMTRDSMAGSLEDTIRRIAAGIPAEFGLAIAAVGLMTVRQCGTAFLTAPYNPRQDKRSTGEVLQSRASNAARGLLAKLTTIGRKPRVIIDERDPEAWFPVTPGQHITTAAELDKRPYHDTDERCYHGMGPIPVDCRSGSCGTCWVGVLNGENLAPPGDFERKRIDYFGYWNSGFHDLKAEKPLIRLACQTLVHGSCSLVIPPWNGVFGKVRRERFRLEP